MGEQMAEAPNVAQGLVQAFRKLTGRRPSQPEFTILLELRDKELNKFRRNQKKMTGWLKAGNYKIKRSADRAQVAANAVVASAIMNTDAAITKR
jgi:hypothetical protein